MVLLVKQQRAKKAAKKPAKKASAAGEAFLSTLFAP